MKVNINVLYASPQGNRKGWSLVKVDGIDPNGESQEVYALTIKEGGDKLASYACEGKQELVDMLEHALKLVRES